MSDVGFDLDTLPPDVKELVKGGRVFKALGADPKFRPRMLEIIKEASPETPIPELDLQRELDGRVTARVKPIEDDNAKLREEVAALTARLSRDDLRAKYDLDDADLQEVDALVKDGKITDTETAIELHRLRMTSSAPRPTTEPGAEAFREKLRKVNPRNVKAVQAAAMQEGNRIIREMRGRRYA